MSSNSSVFLDQVKLIGAIPEGRFTDAEILSLASNQLQAVVVPTILLQKEEYYVRSEDQTVTENQASYAVPYRAMGLSLREVKLIKNERIIDLPRIDPAEIKTTSAGEPWAFYLEGQDVVLYQTPNATNGTLRLSYFLTPSKFVALTEVGLVTNIDRATGVITASVPTTWSTGLTYDLVSSKNGHQTKAFDMVASNVTASTSITFTAADIPSTIVVGDFVCLAGESPYLQCPDVCFRYVIQLTINELMNSMGSQTENQAGMAMAQQLQGMVVSQLQNRVQGAAKKFRIPL